jgi:glycosyltransferase involved in cell wall biosynthesis
MSMSAIADDPRVRRQGDALHDAGWDVYAAGMPGAKSTPPAWPIFSRDDLSSEVGVAIGAPPPPRKLQAALGGAAAGMGLKTADGLLRRVEDASAANRDDEAKYRLRLMSMRWRPVEAHKLYWSFSSNIHDIYRCAAQQAADLWIANDWSVLPIAARLAQEKGGVYVYDSHELASDEYGQDPHWRIYQKPLVDVMESTSIENAAGVSAISQGICDRLATIYPLRAEPVEIRNMPRYQSQSFQPCGDRVRVLYHGVVVPHRGLEAAIESVPLWPPDFTLTLRGPVSESYRAQIESLISQLGLANRVFLAPPVPMTDLIAEANAFDIGLCTPPAHSLHNILSLPNKVFEYVMAGLCLFLTDLPEHRRLVEEHGVGFLAEGESAAALGAAMSKIDRAQIEEAKRCSLAAARQLCWDQEKVRFYAMCSRAVGRPISAANEC